MCQPFSFSDVPSDLKRQLLLGFSGRLHLHALASTASAHLQSNDDTYSEIARDALLTAWGENPFDGNCVAALVGCMQKMSPLPGSLLPTIKAVLAHWKPEVTPEAQVAMAGKPDEQLFFLQKALKQNPRSLFWWHHLYEFARINGNWKVLTDALSTALKPNGLEALFNYALANGLLASGDHLPAAGLYRQCLQTLPLPTVEERLVTAWLRSGKLDKGAELLRQCADKRPWNAGLWLRLYELSMEGAESKADLPGQTMVLGYSWNKAEDLAETLSSLAVSDMSDVQVRILDNGSTDTTPGVIRQFVDQFGSDKAEVVTMPINIGAPAARNWLMALPEVRESDFVAYIDDDISLPADWLQRLGAAEKRYPDSGVWGCKVVDFDGPARIQCGEHNLMPSLEERQNTLMSTIMLQDGDFGQADYIRPCTSVTGCVHMFRTERLLENGSFDLRFAPTQYDDLERDLRMVLNGGYAVYQGFLGIPHKRKSGSMADSGRPESANATGNLHKLLAKYEPEEFEKMAIEMDNVLLADLDTKIDLLKSGETL